MNETSFIKISKDGVLLHIKATPNSKKIQILGQGIGMLRISLMSVPVDNIANIELIKFLSKKTGIKKSKIKIISGEHSREKVILFEGISEIPPFWE